jgi:hypothetical protein
MLADHFRRRAGEMRDLVAHALPVLVEPPAKRQQPAEAAFDHHDPRRAGSVRLHAGELDDLGPLLGFPDEEPAEIGRRAGEHRRAEIGELRPHLGVGKDGVDLVVEPVDDLGGRALAQAHREPLAR